MSKRLRRCEFTPSAIVERLEIRKDAKLLAFTCLDREACADASCPFPTVAFASSVGDEGMNVRVWVAQGRGEPLVEEHTGHRVLVGRRFRRKEEPHLVFTNWSTQSEVGVIELDHPVGVRQARVVAADVV